MVQTQDQERDEKVFVGAQIPLALHRELVMEKLRRRNSQTICELVVEAITDKYGKIDEKN